MPESKHFYQNNKHSLTPLQPPCKNGCTPLIVNHMSFPHSLQHSFFVNCFGDYSLTRLSARILGFVFSRTMFFSCCCSPRPALLTFGQRTRLNQTQTHLETQVRSWNFVEEGFLLWTYVGNSHRTHDLVYASST